MGSKILETKVPKKKYRFSVEWTTKAGNLKLKNFDNYISSANFARDTFKRTGRYVKHFSITHLYMGEDNEN